MSSVLAEDDLAFFGHHVPMINQYSDLHATSKHRVQLACTGACAMMTSFEFWLHGRAHVML